MCIQVAPDPPCHPLFCRHTVEPGTSRDLYDNLIVNEGHAGTQDLESGVFTAAATGGGREEPLARALHRLL